MPSNWVSRFLARQSVLRIAREMNEHDRKEKAMSHLPALPTSAWNISDGGQSLSCWTNDVEFYEINPAPGGTTFELRLNNAAMATTLYLGDSGSIGEAIVRARKHLADQELTPGENGSIDHE